jgi:hypothetical protein
MVSKKKEDTTKDRKKNDVIDVTFESNGESFVSSPSNILPNEESEKGKVPTVRHSGHYVDSKLIHNAPKAPITLFDTLDGKPCQDDSTFEVKYEGIRLTPTQEKLTTAIISLLREKSENKDTKSEAFYKGNVVSNELIEYGENQIRTTLLEVSPSDLYAAYCGSKDYSGKEISEIKNVIDDLQEKRFLVKYDRVRKVKVGKKTEEQTDRIEHTSPLLEVIKYTKGLTNSEKERLDKGEDDDKIRAKKSKIIFRLHPILTDQIETKYVEYPQDISQRTAIASGGKQKVTGAIIDLRDYFLRELSNKRDECQMNADKLPYQLHLDNYIRDKRKRKIQEAINNAIQACKNLNLLLEVKEVIGASGQKKYVFTLNKDFK